MVEDEAAVVTGVRRALEAEGYEVAVTDDGRRGLDLLLTGDFDLAILDVMLPGMNGYELCRTARRHGVRSSILMLSVKNGEWDIAEGLDLGADDYLTKPFSMREVVARVSALLRRVERAAALAEERPATIEVGGVRLDPGSRRTTVDGEAVHLTPTEFDLLLCLARTPGQVLSRERLLREVWDWGDAWASASATRTVDSHVKALRSKVGAARIRTVHGVGYALEELR